MGLLFLVLVAQAGSDRDGDGVSDATDCAPDNPSLSAARWFYRDADGDLAGDPRSAVRACTRPSGYVLNGSDCDDGSDRIGPFQEEVCGTPADDDCDGRVDEPGSDGCRVTWRDDDGDGFGGSLESECVCASLGPEWVLESGDCDDTDPTYAPDADDSTEDGVDWDCDGADVSASGGWATITFSGRATVSAIAWPGAHLDRLLWVARAGRDSAVAGAGVIELYRGAGAHTDVDAIATLAGSETDTFLGVALATGGDPNGDGVDDVVATSYIGDGDGTTWLFESPFGGRAETADAAASWEGRVPENDRPGAVSFVGDADLDGLADVAVGFPEVDTTERDSGAVRILSSADRGAGGVAAAVAVREGVASRGNFGTALLGSVDLDGDGISDLVVSDPAERDTAASEGAVFGFLGPITGTDTADGADWAWFSELSYGGFGDALVDAGDVDGDGLADLLVTSSRAESWLGGVCLLASDGVGFVERSRWLGEDEGVHLSGSAAAGQDLDGDGALDVALGATYVPGIDVGVGGTLVFLAPSAGSIDPDLSDLLIVGRKAGSHGGAMLEMLPDLTGDGTPGLVIADDQRFVAMMDLW